MSRPMELFKRIVAEKRLAVAIVVGLVAIDVGLYAFVVSWSQRVARADARARAATSSQQIAAQRFELARQTLEGTTEADAQLRRFYLEVLPRDLAGARGITFTRLADLATAYNLVMERRTSVPERDEDSQLSRLTITMVLKGAYLNMRGFIYELEVAPEFIVIEEVVLSQGDDRDPGQILNLELATYYRAEPDEAD